MELSVSTFILEIINFLALVWIVKRFLYKPIMDVITRRQKNIEQTLIDAKNLHADAETMQQQYEDRLASWNREKQQAHDRLMHELDNLRSNRMSELQLELEQQREKMQVTETRRISERLHKIEQTAMANAARFASYLLQQSAGPELESRLVELTINELEKLPTDHFVNSNHNDQPVIESVEVSSAHPLSNDQQQRLRKVLTGLGGAKAVPVTFEQDSELIAGTNIKLGPWILATNLRDELKAFAELSQNEPAD